jgi:ANTAR domain
VTTGNCEQPTPSGCGRRSSRRCGWIPTWGLTIQTPSRSSATSLRDALDTQPVIEQAKGMFMLIRGWSADEAFTALRELPQHTNVKLHDVATVVVAAGSRSEPNLPDDEVIQAELREARHLVLGRPFG